ncbi:MAG: DUF1801 domain-containing protein [Halobacteriovoraceae bacterium]|jgi:hypothetical protein|nr:DUF1801 domain-containing protein [Halobacteriovoraceae bacterium]
MNTCFSHKFSHYPVHVKKKLQTLRDLIHNIAGKTNGVGEIEECLKWGEASFVTSETKSGSTIRIDWKENDPDRYHMYFNCQTKLVSIFKELYPNDFDFGGNRSISFSLKENIPKKNLSKCIEIALTYNLNQYRNFFE